MPTRYGGTVEEKRALDAYIKLQRAAETVTANTTAHLAAHGLTTSQFGVLEALHHLGTLSQRDLAQKLLKSSGNISIVLKNLEKRGLISRARNPDDTRYMEVCISDAGRRLLTGFLAQHVRGIVEELRVLTPDEQQELAQTLPQTGPARFHNLTRLVTILSEGRRSPVRYPTRQCRAAGRPTCRVSRASLSPA